MKNFISAVLVFVSSSVFASFGGNFGGNYEEAEVPKETYGGIGISLPMGPSGFTDGWNTGFGGFLASGAGTRIPGYKQMFISVGSRLDFDDFALNTGKLINELADSGITGITISGGDVMMLNVALYCKAAFDYPFASPFISINAGWFQITLNDTKMSGFGNSITLEGSKESAFSIGASGGLTVGGPIWSFIIEPVYILAFTDDEKTQYVAVKAGVYYKK